METLRPWLESVQLHADVLSEHFSEDIFALDLGALSDYLIGKALGLPAARLPQVPAVYRDASSFFAASYLTVGLKSLLQDVLGGLSGGKGGRVLKLVTPFGGGKSHTLAALLHSALSRSALDVLSEAKGLPRPESAKVAVVDGQFFDVAVGKQVPKEGFKAQTIWGWIAWALGGQEGYELVRQQDEQRVAPGGDQIIELLKIGPSLILLDELLEYLISAGGLRVEQTTLRDETLSFLKRLTVAVGNVPDAVLVYSLQSSNRESLEYTGLLQTVEHLAARKDQRREPVEDDEILNVIQRRLLSGPVDAKMAASVAEAYRQVFAQMRRAYAQGDPERQQAEDDGLALRDRIQASYPFHPALIDVMRERWAAIPDFQRTRGALRFLAACLRAAHGAGASRPLLGPGDVPIQDSDVRLAFFKEVGQREDFHACLQHDFVGANARSRRIDERRAREVTAGAGKQPALRLATTMLMYSFGGLRRTDGNDGDALPPGIAEPDLLGISIGPDLDNTTVQACLKELREQCLYLHFDGLRYCFKKDPNVTLLVEQEAEAVAKNEDLVRARIKEMIEARLAGQPSAIVWPAKAADIPDREPRFLIAYLPLEYAELDEAEQQAKVKDFAENYGTRAREFRNAIGFATPTRDQVEVLRRAARYLLAVERVQNKARELNLTNTQKSQVRERTATEATAAESALLKLYEAVLLPTMAGESAAFERVEVGGRPLQTTLDAKKRAQIHQRLLELLTNVQRKVFNTLSPGRTVELFKLGSGENEQTGIAVAKVVTGFFSFLGFPRLTDADAIRRAIIRGLETGDFAYCTGEPQFGASGRYEIDWSRIAFQRRVAEDEIDLDAGFLMTPGTLPERQHGPPLPGQPEYEIRQPPTPYVQGGADTADPQPPTAGSSLRRLEFTADRDKLFSAWNALANLADMAGNVTVSLSVDEAVELDRQRLENGVLEPLRELGLIDDEPSS